MSASTGVVPPWRFERHVRLALIACGLALSLVMVVRCQFGRDQYGLMLLGWRVYADQSLVPYGIWMSGGGLYPGVLQGLLLGLPLYLVEDYRVVALLILVSHIVAYGLLDRVVRDALGWRGRLLFCVLYWFNPWRLYFSTHVWNSNYLFLVGALHFWSAYRLRQRARFAETFVHVTSLGLAAQLHASFPLLVLSSIVLLSRRLIVFRWRAVLPAVLIQVAMVAPYLAMAVEVPQILPFSDEGFIGRGLVTVYPLVRGLGYWVRYASLSLPDKVMVMSWQTLILLHITVLPVICWLDDLADRRPRLVRSVGVTWAVLAWVLTLCVAFGAPMYRRGGHRAIEVAVTEWNPMLDRLGVTARASAYVDPIEGVPPSVFDESLPGVAPDKGYP